MRLAYAVWSRATRRERRCPPPRRSGSLPLRCALRCVLWCMLWCTVSSAAGIGPGLVPGWGGRDAWRALTGCGKSPPDVSPRINTYGFRGCCAPVIASLRPSRLFIHSLLTLGAVARGAEPAPAATEDRDARERRVLAFVAEHQPDLADVLAHLAKKKPDEYAEAIADLDRGVRALSATRAKDERLFGIELRAWQARTRVDLLVAGWLAGGRKDRAKLEPALREAVTAELDAKAEHLAYRKERSAAWYDRQIVRLCDKRDELVSSRLNTLLAPEEKKPKPATGATK